MAISDPLVDAFLEMLAAERGAAANTLEAYRRDLENFSEFLASRNSMIASTRPPDVAA